MDTPGDDLAARGRSIFEQLRVVDERGKTAPAPERSEDPTGLTAPPMEGAAPGEAPASGADDRKAEGNGGSAMAPKDDRGPASDPGPQNGGEDAKEGSIESGGGGMSVSDGGSGAAGSGERHQGDAEADHGGTVTGSPDDSASAAGSGQEPLPPDVGDGDGTDDPPPLEVGGAWETAADRGAIDDEGARAARQSGRREAQVDDDDPGESDPTIEELTKDPEEPGVLARPLFHVEPTPGDQSGAPPERPAANEATLAEAVPEPLTQAAEKEASVAFHVEPAASEPSGGDRPDEASGVPAAAPTPAPRPHRPLPRVLAVANQKGGVGKTTTAVNLGAALAELGYRTLVVDLDPQGNATTGLGINARALETSVYDVLMRELPIEDALEPTSVRNLFVVPATIDLAGAEIELVPAFSRELRLKRALDGAADDFDFTLIDCPPSLGLLTVNALAAANEVVVPVQCEYYALEGLSALLRNVQLVQNNLNKALEVSTIILTMYDARTKLAEQVAQEVRSHFGNVVCRNLVPRTVRLSEAPSYGQPIIVFDPTSRGAIAYRELAKEVSGGSPQRIG